MLNRVAHGSCPASPYWGVGTSSIDSAGGSAIYKGTVATGGEQEIRAAIKVDGNDSSSRFVLYLNASDDARYINGFSKVGTGYAVQFVIVSSPSTTDKKTLNPIVMRLPSSGYPETLSTGPSVDVGLDFNLRVVRTNVAGTWRLTFFANEKYVTMVSDSTFTAGKPGFGISNAPASYLTYFDRVEIATIEHGNPDLSAFPSAFSAVAAPNYVALQWPPATDTDGGSYYGPAGLSH
ncbi:MAG: hypothetical protein U5J83_05320 [Bryobacterales bacterium]|nr:hypothetical protein [Bryobacterales bacterium]